MSALSLLVFLGPTLPAAEARRLCPDATLAPPAAVGDIYRAACARRPPGAIALIDGLFERSAAPWHKELLYALERRVRIYGAASMGALRAAELAPFGMIGVGRVFGAYRRGAITRDDEVAVAHGPAELGWPAFSDALVNVRFALAEAARRGVIGARVHAELFELAKAQFWRDRHWDALLAAGRAAGLPPRALDALGRWLGQTAPNQKRDDACALLRRVHRERDLPRAPRPSWRLSRTWFWAQFVAQHEPRTARGARARRAGRSGGA